MSENRELTAALANAELANTAGSTSAPASSHMASVEAELEVQLRREIASAAGK